MIQTIEFTRLNNLARVPLRASAHAAGFDLVSTGVTFDIKTGLAIVSTGLSTAFDEGHVLLIYGRSGYAFKHGISLANGVGVIDADYRGEIMLAFRMGSLTLSQAEDYLGNDNRVAQAILTPIPSVHWEEVGTLPITVRGTGGLGSTGTKG